MPLNEGGGAYCGEARIFNKTSTIANVRFLCGILFFKKMWFGQKN